MSKYQARVRGAAFDGISAPTRPRSAEQLRQRLVEQGYPYDGVKAK